ncbi:ABC transporter permease subunit [Helcobacillus sp. ACRRO]|uniref:ABC transporter permease subunit n=1 Tax=Helcobacillus sp. ACRRO TaxID=2918202 RepID=UPI001EF479DD|nr:ABC transporter permease subunit [Helcobacillus sp. ACRRO]MCG7426361.1 ABC transporter permease subunit [Helcobacillus sp. ACRRO]
MTDTSAPAHRQRTTSTAALVVKILFLGSVAAAAVWLIPLLIGLKAWLWLTFTVLTVAAIFALYTTKRFIPGKYIFPGTFFLVVFLITPIILTVGYSFTNYGDGSRGTKQEAINSITGNSVQQVDGASRYTLTVGTKGAAEGPYTFFLVDQSTGEAFTGSAEQPLEPVTDGAVTVSSGRVTEADGFTLLKPREVNDHFREISEVAVTVDDTTAVRILDAGTAFQGTKVLQYDEAKDQIVNTATGEVFTVGEVGGEQVFVDADGKRAFSQSWLQGVGFDNYTRLFTNGSVGAQFLKAFAWTLVFAAGSVITTFALGLALALALNDERIRGRRLYRSFLLLPYAVPGFIALLIWSNFYNQDYGLINQLTGLHINWLGDPTWAKVAILLTNLWMGFPYMFIVCTGALQSIPSDVKEAARIDGASSLQTTVKVITPLLLVSIAPLLVASFAFNFNNFNAIELLTGGGPFPDNEFTRGGTDILISMVYRIAFGGSGADFGFASAVSVVLFAITGLLAAFQFRFTKFLEDVN